MRPLKSPFPLDAPGLLTLLGLLAVGLVLFLLARVTGSALLIAAFVAFMFGSLAWLYRRSAVDSNKYFDSTNCQSNDPVAANARTARATGTVRATETQVSRRASRSLGLSSAFRDSHHSVAALKTVVSRARTAVATMAAAPRNSTTAIYGTGRGVQSTLPASTGGG